MSPVEVNTNSVGGIGGFDGIGEGADGAEPLVQLSAHTLLARLPFGVLVIDAAGAVRFANDRALQLVALDSAADAVGRLVTEFVAEEDLGFLVDGLVRGADFPDTILGPFRLRLIDRLGATHWSECWAYSVPLDPGASGYVVTITPESVGVRLAMAAAEIASNDDVKVTLGTICDALAAFPVVATASVLMVHNSAVREAIGSWPSCLDVHLHDIAAPWASVARGGRDREVTVGDLPSEIRESLADTDFSDLWLRAVDVDGHRRAVIAAWRSETVTPTPNQFRHLDQAVDMAELALSRRDHEHRLRHEAHHDALTGVGNRARLNHRLTTAPLPGGLLYIDLDNFKQVNDEDGHTMGDAVLQWVADRLAEVADDDGEVFRVGGDEFVVVFDGSNDTPALTDRMEVAATAVLQCFDEDIHIDGVRTEVTASVGLAIARPHDTWSDMFARADEGLLAAKRTGKQRWSRSPESVSP
jgi:diguanylate cyclase (GGDEF)-like protein